MKNKFTLCCIATLNMLFSYSHLKAENYDVSTGGVINITSPGSHQISGTGSSPVYITNNTAGSTVYNITLSNMKLTAGPWASAINVQNTVSGSTMTVNFIIVGNNTTKGYNHGGIQCIGGTVNVVFTTTSTGTLTSDASYSDSNAFRNNGGTMLPAVDPNVTATATLAGTSKSVAEALTGGFSQKPLVLNLTSSTPPAATTNDASNLSFSGATLNAAVNPGNGSTTVKFEYGLTTAYGTTVNADQTPVTGTTNVSVSSFITGLIPSTTYHYRVVATNGSGTTNGLDKTFTTTQEPITNIALSASSVAENQPSGTVVGSLSATPSIIPCTYSLVSGEGDNDNASFSLKKNSILDQDAGLGDSGIGIFSGYGNIWQSFTAGVSGQLNRIMLRSTNGGSTSYTMKLKVYAGEGVSGTLLGESTAAMTNLGSGYVAWDFSGIPLNRGDKYTFLLTNWTFTDGTGFFAWKDDTHYAGGKMNYSGYPGYELVFKTYMAGTTEIVTGAAFDYETKSAYNVRIKATAGELSYEKALVINVTNVDEPAVATTDDASNISTTGATLNATVNPTNTATTVKFEYGLTTAYGTSVYASQTSIEGTSNVSVTSAISSLTPNTTYHYRVVAVNSAGTTNGMDKTFTTDKLTLSANANALSIGKEGGKLNDLTITSNTNWNYTSNQSWLTVTEAVQPKIAQFKSKAISDYPYTGNKVLKVTATANTTIESRQAEIRLTAAGMADVVITVTQDAGDAVITTDVTKTELDAANQSTKVVSVTSNTWWNAVSDQEWLTIGLNTLSQIPGISKTSSNANTYKYFGNQTLKLIASTNNTSGTRTANVTITGMGIIGSKIIVVTQTPSLATGMDNVDSKTELIYPNPVIDGCFVNTESTGSLAVYDVRGCLVLKKVVNGGEYFDLSNLDKGVYLVKVNGRTAKLIKK